MLAAAAFVPQLLTRPGVVDADTKTYLYVDPGRYLRQSLSMWDPTVGLGTVTHQQIGYLFPMGPFFWASHALGVPTWTAQRLWIGALLFFAGAGVLYLCRTLALEGPGPFTAGFVYMVSPYVLQYVGHISVILLAWSALPWMVALVDRGLSSGRWRYPAALAVLAAAVGSVNATSVVYVAVAPVLWLAYSGLKRLAPWRRVWSVAWRSALLSAGVSAWWLAGLYVEGHYGLDVLKYTETVDAVTSTSLSSEVVRGLGYWYFYGTDTAGQWVPASVGFTTDLWLLGATYAVPLLAVAGAFFTRWRHRPYFIALVVVGTALAVGAHPVFHPSTFGHWLRDLFTESKAGMALRSTDRSAPLALLGLAMLAGAAVSAMTRRARLAGLCAGGALVAMAALSNPPLWNGTTVPTTFTEPSSPPAYVTQAAHSLNSSPGQRASTTRVLAVPGQPFASYRYGTTVDPLWPALLDRPFVTREQQVLGSLPGLDLMNALDDPLQAGTDDAAALAPLARLLSVGDLLVQNDLAYERYQQPDPSLLWQSLDAPQPGLGPARAFGPPTVNDAPKGSVDEGTLAVPTGTPPPPPVAVRTVTAPRPVVRTEKTSHALVVDGDGPGLAAAAAVGLLQNDPTIVYSGTLDGDPSLARATLTAGASLVVTDSNRRQAYRWDNLTNVAGQTLAAGQPYPKHDPADQPLDIFPGAGSDAQSTTLLSGVTSTDASSYGNPFAYLPEDRPNEAVDGDVDTAWETDTFGNPAGQWWQVTYATPVTADAVKVVQPLRGGNNQWITKVTLRFDYAHRVVVPLTAASRTAAGQVITFPVRTFRTLQIDVDATNLGPAHRAGGSPVGLAEVEVHGITAREQLVMPTDLLRTLGTRSNDNPLSFVMTRQRVAAVPPRTDPETALDRILWLPTARRFDLSGTARIDQLATDSLVDTVIGRPSGAGQVTASAGERLLSDLNDTGDAALDGNRSTAWSPPFGRDHQAGERLTVTVPTPMTIDHLNLQVVADVRHSIPTAISLSSGNAPAVQVPLPPIAPGPAGTVVTVPVSFAPVRGSTFIFTVTKVRLRMTYDDDSGNRTVAPFALAELGIPGVIVPPPPTDIPSPCRGDLAEVDGRPLYLAVSGTGAAALDGTGLAVHLCGPDAGGLTLGPGSHEVVAALGRLTGLDLDQLVLDSAPVSPSSGAAVGAAPPSGAGSALHVRSMAATSVTATVQRPPGTELLVLGESIDSGWHAVVGGRDLGPPKLVDGFANGWLLTPSDFDGRAQATVVLRFGPQSIVDVALGVSAGFAILCLLLVAWPRRRTRGQSDVTVPEFTAPEFALPELSYPWEARPRPPWWWALAVAAVAGVLAGALTSWWAAAAVGAGVVLAQLWRGGRSVLALVSTGFVAATAVAMVVIEHNRKLLENGGWPAHFELANWLTWGAVVLLGADAVVELMPWRARPAEHRGSPPPSPPT